MHVSFCLATPVNRHGGWTPIGIARYCSTSAEHARCGQYSIPVHRRDLEVSRLTATKYLDALAEQGFLQKQKIGRTNYYANVVLNRILIGAEMGAGNV